MYVLRVADLGSPSYFVATAAVELGFFADEGIEMATVDGSLSGPEGLADGSVHFFGGPAYGPLRGFPEFAGARILCSLSQYSYWFLGVRADLPLKRGDMNGLKGLRISSSLSWPGLGLQHLLKEAGLDLRKDIEIVPSPSQGKNQRFRANDGSKALEEGISDGFWGNGLRMAYGVASGRAKVHLDLRCGEGPPGARYYNFAALSASHEFVRNNPDVAAGAVRAIAKAQLALVKEPMLAKQVGEKLFPYEEAQLITAAIIHDAPYYQAHVPEAAIDGLNYFCLKSGLIKTPLHYSKVVATELARLWTP